MRTLFVLSGKSTGGVIASALLAVSFASISHASTAIYGTPTTSVAANRYYGFQSWATDTDKRAVTYSIRNKPSWATFDTRYGHLYGVPTSANVGSYQGIVISASDGLSSASLPAFNITVTGTASTGSSGGGSTSGTGSATVNWNPPTQNTNGSTLTNLAGYIIHYGTSTGAMNSSVKVANAGLTSYVVSGLTKGTYYFAVSAYNSSGATSTLSGVASKTVN